MSARAQPRPAAAIRVLPRDRLLRLDPSAWGAIGVVAAFIAITCWWLTQDRSVPIYDAGEHLIAVFTYRDFLLSGNLLGPFNQLTPYPPLAHLVGVFGTLLGGENVAAPIITENLVFGSLLALGCYQIGRLLFDSRAGLLAVMFAFASPLLIAQLHVFMLDAPETALVAVSIWLILASERFSRVGVAALAGMAIGLGLVVKVQFPLFVIGVVGSALLNGGWRNKRGLATFASVTFVIGSPWYINHLADLGLIFQLAGGADSVGHAVHLPSTVSTYNLTWYLWTILDAQLFVPLFLLAAAGAGWTTVALWRDFKQCDRVADLDIERSTSDAARVRAGRLDLLVGAFVAWLGITLSPLHDLRYGLPLLPYIAVVGTGWISALPRSQRWAATGVLVLALIANTLGATFGVGRDVRLDFAGTPISSAGHLDQLTLFSTDGYLVAGPNRDGDVLGLLQALHRNGVVGVALDSQDPPDFSQAGAYALAEVAGLSVENASQLSPQVATLVHRAVAASSPRPCTKLSDGTGVWVLRDDPSIGRQTYYCPFSNPRFYL